MNACNIKKHRGIINLMKQTLWYKDAVVYQIYPRSFCDSNGDGLGDINGIISKLDYLKELGINCIWLSPIYDSPQEDNGYDIANYRDIYKPFGTLEETKILFDEIHKRGMRVIIDLVANHTSKEHEWFKSAISSKESPYRDYYIIKKGRNGGKKPPTNWTGFFSESAWERIGDGDEYYLHLFAKGQPDLNWENPKVREEIKDILRYWLDMGVDGFRCDVINLISKKQDFKNARPSLAITGKHNFINGPRLHEFIHELYKDVLSNYDAMTVGETVLDKLEDVLPLTMPEREELNMTFNFECLDIDALFGVKYFKNKFRLNKWKKTMYKWQSGLYSKSWSTLVIENHDQRRSVGRFNTDEGQYRVESAKSLASMYFLMQGTPFIYQGQELAIANPHFTSVDECQDVEIKNIYKLLNKFKFLKLLVPDKRALEYCRDNARTPILWDDSENGGFTTGTPWLALNKDKSYNAKQALEDKNSLFYHYQSLIKIKGQYNVVKDGEYISLLMKDKNIFAYKRVTSDEELVVISSFSKKTLERKMLNQFKDYTLLLNNYKDIENFEILRPYESRVLYKKK